MSKHSKTPWVVESEISPENPSIDRFWITPESDCNELVCKSVSESNAAHIVRCVNAHDALVRALESLVNYCQTPAHLAEGITRTPRQMDIDKARAALALARGEK